MDSLDIPGGEGLPPDEESPSPEGFVRAIRRLAHDLNNTLTVIQGNAELARTDLIPQHPAWESVIEIREAGIKAREQVILVLDLCHRYQAKAVACSASSNPINGSDATPPQPR
jgi:hypothetical protein